MPDPERTPSPEPNEPTTVRLLEGCEYHSEVQDPSQLNETIKKLHSLSIDREAGKKLIGSFDLDGIADYVKEHQVKKVIFMCGAGISVNAGIPDFRSPKTGIFSRLKEMGLSRPEEVFDINFFRKDPAPFYSLAKRWA